MSRSCETENRIEFDENAQVANTILTANNNSKNSHKIPTKRKNYIAPIKKVHFSLDNLIIIVPSRVDLMPSFSDLWWQDVELQIFQAEAYSQMRQYLHLNKCNIRQGLTSIGRIYESIAEGQSNSSIGSKSSCLERYVQDEIKSQLSSAENYNILAPKPIRRKKISLLN